MIDPKVNWIGCATEDPESANVCILGVPYDGGASQGRGAAYAPMHIRHLAADDMPSATDDHVLLKPQGIYDAGDVSIDLSVDSTFTRVEAEAYKLLSYGKFCVFLGGDHSVTIPLHKAWKRHVSEQRPGAKLGILHFDAHYDLCEKFNNSAWSHACTERRAAEDIVDPEGLFFLGVRAAEPDEIDFIKAHPEISIISASELFETGCEQAYERIAAKFENYDAVYFTLDIDVLDPAYAPGTGTPVAGGLSSRELIYFLRKLLRGLPISAMDIVEVSPPLDSSDITTWAAIRVLQEVFSAKCR